MVQIAGGGTAPPKKKPKPKPKPTTTYATPAPTPPKPTVGRRGGTPKGVGSMPHGVMMSGGKKPGQMVVMSRKMAGMSKPKPQPKMAPPVLPKKKKSTTERIVSDWDRWMHGTMGG